MNKSIYRGMKGLTLAIAITGIATLATDDIRATTKADARQKYSVYVDNEGVMRRSDTNKEVSYYGTNYTLPFAHAYRAATTLGEDRKAAISRDVAHMARLGFNGFRLHLWDVELTDADGNLLLNDHLDLLDYLIARLEDAGIDIILTAQTNFGNGYPERDIDTGAYSYRFDKCQVHENPAARKAQENYLRQLATHVNPYTGRSYAADRAIIAMEINNEPCHSGTPRQVTAYIDRMADALRESGFDKPILYNVSHNPEVTSAYYDAKIEGTTYQWYPDGLVAGHTRRGNFLPAVERYTIPWSDTIPGFKTTAKIVYEFDPGDQQSSYLYPAIARTFRENGFQWMTQFAYDPTFLAPYNTEYQTHFLNLLYTPSKAISMMVAAEAARNLKRGERYGTYPADSVFGAGRVSYREDLSEWNDGRLFYHSNPTSARPANMKKLERIAGVGSSPIVEYKGTGAYFLDKGANGVWRLEVLPDAAFSSDPFEKPSLEKQVAHLADRPRKMKISLPDLGDDFTILSVTGDAKDLTVREGSFTIEPGVYLLTRSNLKPTKDELALFDIPGYDADHYSGVGVKAIPGRNFLLHTPKPAAAPGDEVEIRADWFGSERPDSLVIYPAEVSFWAKKNPSLTMTPDDDGYTFSARLKMKESGRPLSYNIITYKDGRAVTWPQGVEGTPLDWDFTDYAYYTTVSRRADSPLTLMDAGRDKDVEVARIPEAWDYDFTTVSGDPRHHPQWLVNARDNGSLPGETILRRYIGNETASTPGISDKQKFAVKTRGAKYLEIADRNGYTFRATLADTDEEQIISLPDFHPAPTRIIPAPYPTFLERSVDITPADAHLEAADMEFVQIVFDGPGALSYIILE